MGASHTKLASNAGEEAPELEGDVLGSYVIDQPLFPASGRMLRTFKLRHKLSSSAIVLKSMWVTSDLESVVTQQQEELEKIQKAVKGQNHIAPFLYWNVGSYRPRPGTSDMVRQINLLRPHFYTTLSDRLASRPFLTHVEKLWISFQILEALDALHSSNIVHGFLTAENIGLSSWNWVVLVDVASYKARTALPDDDPSDYLYYFQELYNHGKDTTPREKRCYLAPERFFTPSSGEHHQDRQQPSLTPAMDIFSAGCVIMETFLNGERALDLGDLMEYRKQGSSQTLQQKLNKIEFSALRAACRHMLHLDPSERLGASAYLERLKASDIFPESFGKVLSPMMERITYSNPDARLAIAAAHYYPVIWETMGIKDEEGKKYVEKALGKTMADLEAPEKGDNEDVISSPTGTSSEEKKEEISDILAETEELLKRLENLNFDQEQNVSAAATDSTSALPNAETTSTGDVKVERSQVSQSSLLIYLQSILSTVRHVQRPASKLVALQLMKQVGKFSNDEARLQRIIPVTISLLHDQDPLVRASAIHVLASTLSIVDSFPPSDSKVFPRYIFKRVTHLMTDPSLVVRLVFAKSVAVLAETSHRFLDISHAVRLYEAVGGGGSRSPGILDGSKEPSSTSNDVFTDDVAKLLDQGSESDGKPSTTEKKDSVAESNNSDGVVGSAKTLISSNYNSELAALHETISRWVVHITTDQSEHSSPVKRALLSDIARLCNFFGLDGVMAFILPQILTFLNDRKDWQLRAALFEYLPAVCHIIGRAATEHFVLPCLETALVDGEEAVVSRALQCLAHLLRLGLLSRSVLLGTYSKVGVGSESTGLLKKYGALLVHPSADVRFFATCTVNAVCESLGSPDADVFVVPMLRPFLRYQPSPRHLTTRDGIESCLHPPWTRERFQGELNKCLASNGSSLPPTDGQWTSIDFQVRDGEADGKGETQSQLGKEKEKDKNTSNENKVDSQTEQVRSYLQMLARRSRTRAMKDETDFLAVKTQLAHAIEGSLKLAQQIKFPRQDNPSNTATLPAWYKTLRETQETQGQGASETAAIRSVSALGQVYGLSIMDQSAASGPSSDMTTDRASGILQSDESRMIEAACSGEWGSEVCLNTTLQDTSLLVTKLNALQVPPLPPKLIDDRISRRAASAPNAAATKESPSTSTEWKPRIDTVVASSRTSSEFGHTAPVVRLVVSNDQRFFASGSHDGTCRVWELDKAEKCNGILESSSTYSGHLSKGTESIPRVTDLSLLEGSHSVCSATSDGSIHVWRVDMVSSTKQSSTPASGSEASRVAGSSEIRKMNPGEGEILALNHFNTSAASILTFATQKGFVHSWDLRSATEPFLLKNPQDTGYITSCAVGSDRNWIVTGTSRGFVALWDLRFQQILKLWHHSRSAPINRLGTSFVSAPQSWAGRSTSEMKPFLFVASGPNECAMFDVSTGACRECFRTVDYGGRFSNARLDEIPHLDELPLSASARRRAIMSQGLGTGLGDISTLSTPTINAMVGSIGASNYSFLLTGGSDCRIRFWDFAVPSKCYVSSGTDRTQPRSTFERIDYDQSCRMMLCRQPPRQHIGDIESSRVPKKLFQGLKKPENCHQDSIQDLKVVKSGLLSCSRDCTVKLWR